MADVPFLDEVETQPQVLRGLAQAYQGPWREPLARAAELLKGKPLTLFFGMGSSYHAGMIAATRLAGAGRAAFAEDASELLHYRMGLLREPVALVAISQSGESAETCRVAQERPAGTPLVAITNDPESSLARSADLVLPLLAGPEVGTSNKTYLASIAIGLLLASSVLGEEESAYGALPQVIDGVAEALVVAHREAPAIVDHWEAAGPAGSLIAVGRGPAHATALQAALILKEMTGVHVEGLSAGMFRHGPVELAGSGTIFIIFAPAGRTSALLQGLVADLNAWNSRLWIVTDEENEARFRNLGANAVVTVLPHVPEEWAAITSIVPVELASAELARRRGLVPGQLRKTPKVTSRE